MEDWVPIEEVLNVVEKARKGKWLWPLNWDCKYIDLRVDMRDGCCIIKDRNGKVISLADLHKQTLLKAN